MGKFKTNDEDGKKAFYRNYTSKFLNYNCRQVNTNIHVSRSNDTARHQPHNHKYRAHCLVAYSPFTPQNNHQYSNFADFFAKDVKEFLEKTKHTKAKNITWQIEFNKNDNNEYKPVDHYLLDEQILHMLNHYYGIFKFDKKNYANKCHESSAMSSLLISTMITNSPNELLILVSPLR